MRLDRGFDLGSHYCKMGSSLYRKLGPVGLLAGTLTVAAPAAPPRRPVPPSYSVAQLQNDIRKLEANWHDPKWKANVAREEVRKLITRCVAEQLNSEPAAAQAIQKSLASAINAGVARSWSLGSEDGGEMEGWDMDLVSLFDGSAAPQEHSIQ